MKAVQAKTAALVKATALPTPQPPQPDTDIVDEAYERVKNRLGLVVKAPPAALFPQHLQAAAAEAVAESKSKILIFKAALAAERAAIAAEKQDMP